MNGFADELFYFIDQAFTPYHAQKLLADVFKQQGFVEKNSSDPRSPYLCFLGEGSLLAVVPGTNPMQTDAARVVLSHLDSPCLKLKESPDEYDGLARVRVQAYGGLRLESFADRPLRLAGRAYLKKEGEVRAQTFVSEQRLVIPSLAMHLEKEEKNSVQMHYPAVWSSQEKTIQSHLLELLDCQAAELLTYDAFLLPDQIAQRLAPQDTLFMAPRIDDLSMAFAQMRVFAHTKPQPHSQFAFFLNHEETGSMSREGAFSSLLLRYLESYVVAHDPSRAVFLDWLQRVQMLSLDVAHAYHPAYPERYDKNTSPVLGEGVAIKRSATGKYGMDTRLYAHMKMHCAQQKIKFQTYENHADIKGGTTIGPMSSAVTGATVLDVGAPILGMHAALELADIKDIQDTASFVEVFLREA